MTEARIPPLPAEEWDDEMWEALAPIGAKRPAPGEPAFPSSNLLGIYAWNPPFAAGWVPFSAHLKHSSLTDRVREIAIVRTTWLRGGEYEWAQHRLIARGAGLSEAEIDALSGGPAVSWAEADAVLVRAIDELCEERTISDATWRLLERRFTRAQLVDLVFTVATYDMHCLAFGALGLQLDAGLEGFPPGRRPGAR